jgi:phytoene dehydrogenase-like protein
MSGVIVIGAGPNGLVAANLLADAGIDVTVLEAQDDPGGAVRSGELTQPGFLHDRFSAFYPLGVASPVFRRLELEQHGLVWRRSPAALAHVYPDGRSVVLHGDRHATATGLERGATGDGAAWLQLVAEWDRIGKALTGALLEPFPATGSVARLLGGLRHPRPVAELAHRCTQTVRAFTRQWFRGEDAAMLIAGNTMHTDLSPESALGGFYGWLLAMLAQSVGYPAPEGGSGALTTALVRRLETRGGVLRCSARVDRVVVRGGRAVAVRLADGEEVAAPGGVVAAVGATALYRHLVGEDHLPARLVRDLEGFELDHGTFKVDWALSGAIPWRDPAALDAGTLHLGDGLDHLTRFAADVAAGTLPEDPFVLFGQMNRVDPTRSPPGTETAWAYTHVPNPVARPGGVAWDEPTVAKVVDRIEHMVEQRAPGFRDLIVGRHVMTPHDLERADANLVGGSLNGGTSQLHQQLVFRPTMGWPGPGTPVRDLWLASASAHPGGGVHGACGANAARALLRRRRVRRALGG